ncbi:MAG: CopD family protein [Pseudomonadota bacterium]
MTPDSASALLRSLGFVLLFQAAGAVFFTALVSGLLDRSAGTIRRLQLWSAAAAIAVLSVQLCLQPARLAGTYSGVFDPAMWDVVWGASGARACAVQLIGLAAIASGTSGQGKVCRWVGMTGAFTTLAAFLLTGHTSAGEWRPELAPMLLIHVSTIAFWFGSLLPLHAMLRKETTAVAAAALRQFSSKAILLVPLLAFAGVRLLLGIAHGLPDFRAPYGKLILAKIAGFTLLLGLAAWNKVILLPAVAANRPGARDLLQRSLLVEFLLMVAVLAVTAIMTSFYSP